MNQISLASLMMHLNMTKQKTVDEDMVRHMILNSIRLYRNMFKDKYGDFGKDYIESHHENVLSERPEEEWSNEVKTSIDDIKVLCSNCHRMVHHKRPALSFNELLDLLEM